MRTIPVLDRRTRVVIAALWGLTGWFQTILGWAYLPFTRGPATLPDALVTLTSLFPLWVLGAMWSAAGALMIIAATTQLRRGWFAWSLASSCFMHTLFFIFYSWAYFAGDHRAYVGAVLYMQPTFLFCVVAILIVVLRPKVSR